MTPRKEKPAGFGGFRNEASNLTFKDIKSKAIIFYNENKLLKSKIQFLKVLEFDESDLSSLEYLSKINYKLKRYKESEIYLEKLISLKPNSESFYIQLGGLYEKTLEYQKAINLYYRYLKINPNNASIYNDIGVLLYKVGDMKTSKEFYIKAIEIKPNFSQAINNLAAIYAASGDNSQAVNLYKKVLSINPNYSEAYYNLGNILRRQGKLEESITSLKDCLNINPGNVLAKSELLHTQSLICDWNDIEVVNKWLEELMRTNVSVNPMSLFSLTDDPLLHLTISQRLFSNLTSKPIKYKLKNKKVRIGYFSADFCDHPVMQLLIRSIELHNRDEFEIFLYDLFPRKNDNYTKRIKNTFSTYKDISQLSNDSALASIREDQLDIAIDLMGHTKFNRLELFIRRVAPIQINYLGYPGSIGFNSHDYIIGDKNLLPLDNQIYFTEKILHLPRIYQCIDDKLAISEKDFKKSDFGIPENNFIFTSFNSCYKITKREFKIWMSLLNKVENSCLWLYVTKEITKQNILNEALKQKIKPSKIIFAENININEHLSRHKLGDLFLDTFNYSAGVTAALALYAGMPVVSLMGKSYSARMASSLLAALGMNELIANSPDQYKNKAFRLASDHDFYNSTKNKMLNVIEKSEIFNSFEFTNDLETLYKQLINKL